MLTFPCGELAGAVSQAPSAETDRQVSDIAIGGELCEQAYPGLSDLPLDINFTEDGELVIRFETVHQPAIRLVRAIAARWPLWDVYLRPHEACTTTNATKRRRRKRRQMNDANKNMTKKYWVFAQTHNRQSDAPVGSRDLDEPGARVEFTRRDLEHLFASGSEVEVPAPDCTEFYRVADKLGVAHVIRLDHRIGRLELRADAFVITATHAYLGFETLEAFAGVANEVLHPWTDGGDEVE